MKRNLSLFAVALVVFAVAVSCAASGHVTDELSQVSTQDPATIVAAVSEPEPVIEEDYSWYEPVDFMSTPEPVDSGWTSDVWNSAAVGTNGATACSNPIAAQIGTQILEQGGNAVDAAVAMIYAVGLLEPAASGIGGAGQMLVYLADQDKYINIEYLTQVPSNARIGETDTDGSSNPPSVQSIAIPGVVHGTLTALEMYGTMTPAQVLAPVIELAREGFELPARWNSNLDGRYANISAYEYTLNLYTDEGFFYEEGDIITNDDLADTLELIANEGIEGFYDSDFTDMMVDYIQSLGGILTHEDFANYKTVIREPLVTTYRDHKVITVSAPTKGGVALVEALNIAENFDLASLGFDNPTTVQLKAESFLLGCKDGVSFVSDPAYYDMPIDTITSKEYAAERAKLITPNQKMRTASAGKLQVSLTETGEKVKNGDVFDPGGTTHLVCMDKYGNVVSTTNTNGQNFGSALAVPGTGFVFSAHLMLFDNQGFRKVDALLPGAKTSSTICPTIVADANGKPVLALGSPGNWCTCSATFEAIINYVDFGFDAAQIVNAPRTYRDYMTSKSIYVENYSLETYKGLLDMGFDVIGSDISAGYSSHVGSLAAVEVLEDGTFRAVGDHRRYYGASAY